MATANIGDHISCFLNSDRCSCTDCTGLDPPLASKSKSGCQWLSNLKGPSLHTGDQKKEEG